MRLLLRKREQRVANSVIADPEEHTTMAASGAVRSIQAANIDMPESELEQIWTASHLERLARTYWKYLSRVTLGLIRVVYSDTERAVVLICRPFVLLRFQPPEYELSATRGIVRWRIRDGILVATRNEGYLEIDVRRLPSPREGYGRVHVEVEVASFYPRLAASIANWFYQHTQSRIHIVVTHGFLRSLARLEFEESTIGRFAERANGTDPDMPATPAPGEEINVGDTPWLVVAAIGAVGAAAGALIALAWRARR